MKTILKRVLGVFGLHNDKTFCPVCGASDVAFQPLPDLYRQNAQQYGYMHFGKGEMTTLETYSCDNCGASDRERLYAFWLNQEIKSGKLSHSYTAIHFAPEQALSNLIRHKRFFGDYQTADLTMDAVDHKVDLMNLKFADNSYDFFICSHVLEHVPDDAKAISELYRITRPGGCGILMAPIAVGLLRTIEDPTAITEADRWRLFGQFDHVRLYAHDDYVHKITQCGFVVQQLGIEEIGANVFSRLGLKDTSILYIVSKK